MAAAAMALPTLRLAWNGPVVTRFATRYSAIRLPDLTLRVDSAGTRWTARVGHQLLAGDYATPEEAQLAAERAARPERPAHPGLAAQPPTYLGTATQGQEPAKRWLTWRELPAALRVSHYEGQFRSAEQVDADTIRLHVRSKWDEETSTYQRRPGDTDPRTGTERWVVVASDVEENRSR